MSKHNYRELDLIRQMESEMARIAEEAMRGFFSDAAAPNRNWQPRVDVYETAEEIVVKAEVSGVRIENLRVVLGADDRILTISGDRDEAPTQRSERIRCYQLEINYGSFERQIMIPPDCRVSRETISATCRDGFLEVTLPKRVVGPSEIKQITIKEL